MTPTLAITAGDPCGIGPEVILKALARLGRVGSLVIIGDHAVFERAAARLRQRLPRWEVVRPGTCWRSEPQHLTFLDRGSTARFHPGRSSTRAGAASVSYLDLAIGLWRAGKIQALVTGPVTKWAAAQAQAGFVGQTEYLADAMRARDVVMMFASARLRVALVTRHLPLEAVSRAVTPRLLRVTVRRTAQGLRDWFGIASPRLAVCGINPHAGEAGRFGLEERQVLIPTLRALRRKGMACDGPLAADGLFANCSRYDAIVCAYHDQGLIPFKMVARDRGCQLSLGLPIPRTSPDHGSALDIAGRGVTDPGSMIYAIRLADQLARRRRT